MLLLSEKKKTKLHHQHKEKIEEERLDETLIEENKIRGRETRLIQVTESDKSKGVNTDKIFFRIYYGA